MATLVELKGVFVLEDLDCLNDCRPLTAENR